MSWFYFSGGGQDVLREGATDDQHPFPKTASDQQVSSAASKYSDLSSAN